MIDENQVFLELIKYIISTLIPQCPKEILPELYSFIRKLFLEMESTFNSYHIKNYSSKERNMEPNNYATIPCKIYDLEIPHALLDTGSDGSHLSDNIGYYIEKYFGLKMDRKKTYRLSGAVGEKQSIGTFHDIPITIGIGNDTVNISDEFSVFPTEKDHNGKDISLFILGTRWQHHAGWEPIVKGEFKASCNGKTITIPISIHKPQQNVFSKSSINNHRKNENNSVSTVNENVLTAINSVSTVNENVLTSNNSVSMKNNNVLTVLI
nr:6087_t:CDS:2 [Entrophospora candida]